MRSCRLVRCWTCLWTQVCSLMPRPTTGPINDPTASAAEVSRPGADPGRRSPNLGKYLETHRQDRPSPGLFMLRLASAGGRAAARHAKPERSLPSTTPAIASSPAIYLHHLAVLTTSPLPRGSTPSSATYIIWRDAVPVDETSRNGMDWTRVDRGVSKARIWDWMTRPDTPLNCTKGQHPRRHRRHLGEHGSRHGGARQWSIANAPPRAPRRRWPLALAAMHRRRCPAGLDGTGDLPGSPAYQEPTWPPTTPTWTPIAFGGTNSMSTPSVEQHAIFIRQRRPVFSARLSAENMLCS